MFTLEFRSCEWPPARRKPLRELRLLRHLESGIIDVVWHVDIVHDTLSRYTYIQIIYECVYVQRI